MKKNLPYRVLGSYHPTFWKAWKVGRDLTNITKSHGLIPHDDPAHGPIHWKKGWYSDELHAEVRKKTSQRALQAEDWHYDGDTTPDAKPDCALVLWATATPTEFMYKGQIYQPKPFEIVIAKNLVVRHRRPAGCPVDRWVFRQRVATPPDSFFNA